MAQWMATEGSSTRPPSLAIRLVIGAEIGSFSLIPFWDGKIDDVRIYNRGLSAGEVSELYDLVEKPAPSNKHLRDRRG